MCSVPPKFYQVCRLCLMLIEENDISAHRIYSTISVPTDFNNECKCLKSEDIKCSNKDRKCCNCEKYQNKQNIPTISSSPRVPLSPNPLRTISFNLNFNGEYADKSNELDIRNQSTSIYSTSNVTKRIKGLQNNLYDDSKTFRSDDSPANIVTQILKCLSIEVSTYNNASYYL